MEVSMSFITKTQINLVIKLNYFLVRNRVKRMPRKIALWHSLISGTHVPISALSSHQIQMERSFLCMLSIEIHFFLKKKSRKRKNSKQIKTLSSVGSAAKADRS